MLKQDTVHAFLIDEIVAISRDSTMRDQITTTPVRQPAAFGVGARDTAAWKWYSKIGKFYQSAVILLEGKEEPYGKDSWFKLDAENYF